MAVSEIVFLNHLTVAAEPQLPAATRAQDRLQISMVVKMIVGDDHQVDVFSRVAMPDWRLRGDFAVRLPLIRFQAVLCRRWAMKYPPPMYWGGVSIFERREKRRGPGMVGDSEL